MIRFTVWNSQNGWRWTAKKKGRIVASSAGDGYTRRRNCVQSLNRFIEDISAKQYDIHILPKIALALLLLVALAACAGHISKTDIVSNTVDAGAKAYLAGEDLLIEAHRSGVITGDKWTAVCDIRNEKAKPAFQTLMNAWNIYATSGSPGDFTALLERMSELAALLADLDDAYLNGKLAPTLTEFNRLIAILRGLK